MSNNRPYKKIIASTLITAAFLCACYIVFDKALIKPKIDSFEKTIQELAKNFTREPISIGSIRYNIFSHSFTLYDVQFQSKDNYPVLYTSKNVPEDLSYQTNSYEITDDLRKIFLHDLARQLFGYFQTNDVHIEKITLYPGHTDTYEPTKQADTSAVNKQVLHLKKISLENIKIILDKPSYLYEQNVKELILSNLTLQPEDNLSVTVTGNVILNGYSAKGSLKNYKGGSLLKQTQFPCTIGHLTVDGFSSDISRLYSVLDRSLTRNIYTFPSGLSMQRVHVEDYYERIPKNADGNYFGGWLYGDTTEQIEEADELSFEYLDLQDYSWTGVSSLRLRGFSSIQNQNGEKKAVSIKELAGGKIDYDASAGSQVSYFSLQKIQGYALSSISISLDDEKIIEADMLTINITDEESTNDLLLKSSVKNLRIYSQNISKTPAFNKLTQKLKRLTIEKIPAFSQLNQDLKQLPHIVSEKNLHLNYVVSKKTENISNNSTPEEMRIRLDVLGEDLGEIHIESSCALEHFYANGDVALDDVDEVFYFSTIFTNVSVEDHAYLPSSSEILVKEIHASIKDTKISDLFFDLFYPNINPHLARKAFAQALQKKSDTKEVKDLVEFILNKGDLIWTLSFPEPYSVNQVLKKLKSVQSLENGAFSLSYTPPSP